MRIALTSVMVDDQERALRFYTDTLGFVVRQDFPAGGARWITVASPEGPEGVEVALEPTGHPAARPFQQALYESGTPLTAFASADVQAEYERLVARGVRFQSPPKSSGPFTYAVFDDTVGNWIQIFQVAGAPAGAA